MEFGTREDLIEALKRTDTEIYGRKMRVNVSDKQDLHHTDGGRGGFSGGQRPNRGGPGGEERPEMASTWRRAERKLFLEKGNSLIKLYFQLEMKIHPMNVRKVDSIVIDQIDTIMADVSSTSNELFYWLF